MQTLPFASFVASVTLFVLIHSGVSFAQEPPSNLTADSIKALRRQKRFAEAVAEFDAALEIDPDCVDALFWKLELPSQESNLYRILRLDPDHAVAYIKKTWNPRNSVAPEKVIVLASRAMSLEPEWDVPYLVRGHAWLDLGNRRGAEADYETYLELSPDRNVGVVGALAFFYATSEDPKARDGERALALAKEALAASYGELFADFVAAAYAELGQFGLAKEWQAKHIRQLEREAQVIYIDSPNPAVRELPLARRYLAMYEQGKPRRKALEPEPKPKPVLDPNDPFRP